MTWARFLATGSGEIAARLSIEGLPYEFVSDPAMEKTTTDGRIRVYALPEMGKGIVIEEKVNIPEAQLDASGISIRLFETQAEQVSKALTWKPDVERFIDATITAAATSVTLLSATGIAIDDVVHVGTEAMLVTNVVGAVLTVTRAYWSTIAQQHWSNETGIRRRMLSNRPYRVRGRRARLYAYGDGDDLSGDGTQVWLGTVVSEPECSSAGEVWSVQLASIAKRLDAKLGGGIETPLTVRGIYYPWSAPLYVYLREVTAGPTTEDAEVVFTGFYATQRAFIIALQAAIDAAVTAATLVGTYTVEETLDGAWTLSVVTTAAITEFRWMIASYQDGSGDGVMTTDGASVDWTGLTVGTRYYVATWDAMPGGLHADNARLVPRGCFGVPPIQGWTRRDESVRATYPEHRIYISGAFADDADSVQIEWPSGASRSCKVTASDASGWITLRNTPPVSEGTYFTETYGGQRVPTIKQVRRLAQGSLSDLRAAIVSDGITYASRGAAPFLTSADLGDWTTVVPLQASLGFAERSGMLVNREWYLYQAQDLLDVLRAEMQLLSVFPVIDSAGKVNLASMDIPNATTAGATDLDDELITVDWSSMARGGQTVNRAIVKANYDPAEDEWSNEHTVLDETAYAQDHEYRDIEIEPRSTWSMGDSAITVEDVIGIVNPVLNLFGYPHDFVTIQVPWKHFDVLLGNVVTFSADHLPDARTGVRGIAAAIGIVVGRKWEFGAAHGTIRVLIPWLDVAGYSPTARVTATGDQGGNLWALTVNSTLYAPTGHTVAEFFAVGDEVRVIQYDSESPAIVAGSVTASDTGTSIITVQFDGVFTPGASTWELCFDNHANVDATQKSYAFVADTGALLGTDGARQFAP